MNKKKVTSSDVAKYAGVSQTTVSMILNKKYNVSFSKEVVKKVEDAARELGYVLPKRRTQKESRREKLLVVFCRIMSCFCRESKQEQRSRGSGCLCVIPREIWSWRSVI